MKQAPIPSRRLAAPACAFAALLVLALSATPCLSQTQARMSGGVAAPDGTPLDGVTVTLEPTDGDGARVAAKTNKKGRYLIGMVRPGAYRLVVAAPEGTAVLRVKGRAVNPDAGREELWAIDQAVGPSLPALNIGVRNEIAMDLVVGPADQRATPAPTPAPAAAAAAATAAEPDVRAEFETARARVEAGEYAEALELLVPMTTKVPHDPATWYLVAFSQERLSQWEDAKAAIDRVLTLDSKLAGAHLLAGRALKGLGRSAEAEAELKLEIEAHSSPKLVADAWTVLAALYKQDARLPEAARAIESAVAVDPSRRELLLELSRLYAAAGQPEKAAEAMTRAEAAGSTDDAALLNLAIGYLNESKPDEARSLANRLLERGSTNPNLSLAHSILARCDLSAGKLEDGAGHLEKALELDPNSKLAADNRQILASLRRK